MNYLRRFTKHIALLTAFILVTVALAYAWGYNGHRLINRKAAMHLPNAMSSFRADSLFYETHASDADNRRNSSDTTFNAEQWRHYIDIDDYPNFQSIPRDLNTLINIYGYERVKRNGLNPWVTACHVDSITAQLQRGDLAKAKLTMSDLGHYVGDAHQPLHCTENYDGQFTGNNGIHSRYESSMINAYLFAINVHHDTAQYISSPLDFAFEYIYHSQSLVDSVLAADNYAKTATGWNGSGTPPANYYPALWQKCQSFTIDQFQRATEDLASLWYTAWVNAGLSTDVDESLDHIPHGFALMQNYPNPFNPMTNFEFRVSNFEFISLRVYDVLGREVATLVNEPKSPGSYSVAWDAKGMASGIYFYQMRDGKLAETRKLLLLK